MVKRFAFFVLALCLVFGVGAAFAEQNESEQENEVEFENEVELEHGQEVEHCPGGGQIFTANLNIADPSGTTPGSFSVDIRHDDCVAEVKAENEMENEHVAGVSHASGQFEINDDNSITFSNATTTRGTHVTSVAGDDFSVNCTQTTNGTLNASGDTFEGEVVVTCTGSGKMIKRLDDLFLEIPNL